MLNRFITSIGITTENIKLPSHDNIMSKLDVNINKLTKHLETSISTLSSNSIVYTLIQITPKSKTKPTFELIDSRLNEFRNDLSHYGITTTNDIKRSNNSGVFDGRLAEQWIAVTDVSNSNYFQSSELKPVRCVYHPFTNLNYWIDEMDGVSSDNMAFFTIDLRALIQSVNDYYKKIDEFNIRNYIKTTLYSDILKDIVKITHFNRLNRLYLGEIIPTEIIRKKPTWLDLVLDLDDYYKESLKMLSNTRAGLNTLSQNLFLTKNENLFNLLNEFPRLTGIGNIGAIYQCATLPYIHFLLDLNKKNNGTIDISFNRYIKTQIEIAENNVTINQKAPHAVQWRNIYFENIKKIIK